MKGFYDLIFSEDLSFEDYFLNDEESAISFFPKFNCINIIVGANNSGKSRFIRQLMSSNNFNGIKDLFFLQKEIINYNEKISDVNFDIHARYLLHSEKSKNTLYINGINTDQENANILAKNELKDLDLNSLEDIIEVIKENKVKLNNLKSFNISDDYIFNYSKIQNDFFKVFKDFKKYYIPTLRTAHSLFSAQTEKFAKIESDIYLETLNVYYNLNSMNVEVFTAVHLYKEILNTRNSRREVRDKFEKFEEFISVNFFDGKKIDIVAEFDKDESLKGNNNSEIISVHIEGENETRKLYQLGDGIQALIILMYKIFMAESESFIFIDEPEINLHPGMQRLFLEQITSNKILKNKKLKYIITTHSNHFLDLTIEKDNVSIYLFSPRGNELNDKQFLIKNVNRGDNKILKDLGVNNSSVFMANCSIWIEGISDRNYIKAFLKSYCDFVYKNDRKNYISIKEDIDFAFFEYAGSNIEHYFFDKLIENEDEREEIVLKEIKALAVSNRIFLLADSDASKKNSKKGIRLKKLEDAQTDNFIPKIIWNVREVENLLTNEIWKEVLIKFCSKALVKSNKDKILLKIDEALSHINSTSFSKEYVGEFLAKVRERMGKISSKSILNQSAYEVKSDGSFGTIVNKRELSELVFNKNFSWEILSKNKEIEKLTIEIYNFITQK